MGSSLSRIFAAFALSAACAMASAEPEMIKQALPDLAADALADPDAVNSGPVIQELGSFGVFQNTHRVTRIEWWGVLFGTTNPLPEVFSVRFNDYQFVGDVASYVDTDYGDLLRFRLDIGQGGLAIKDDNELAIQYGPLGPNVVAEGYWAWSVVDDPLNTTPADIHSYRISGEVTNVPEPASALLVAIAGLALLATRRRA